MMSNFRDPNFEEATRELFKVTRAAIIEWLSRGGVITMAIQERKRTWRWWMREHALAMFLIAMATGLCLGWLLRMLWFE